MGYPRISGVAGQDIDLSNTFFRNGVPADPYAIRKIEIYQGSTLPENLKAEIIFPDPDDPDYPFPAVPGGGICGCLPEGSNDEGTFTVTFAVPADFETDAYFDVWYFIPEEPASDIDFDDETLWSRKCNRFWINEDAWYLDDCLETVRLSFEPLDQTFYRPEKRWLEVGIMPLPLYDYNYNLVTPMLPFVNATITISKGCEVLADFDNVPMCLGLRQGTYRSNPYVFKFLLDTSLFLSGTYTYRVTANLPNGTVLVSPDFNFTVV